MRGRGRRAESAGQRAPDPELVEGRRAEGKIDD